MSYEVRAQLVKPKNDTDDARPSPGVREYIDLLDRAHNPLVKQLLEALTCYGQHNAGCSARHGAEYRCRCGWRETAAALRVTEGLEK